MCIVIIIRIRYVYLFVLLYKSPGKVTQHLSNAPTRSDRFTCTPITAPIRYNTTRRFLLLHRWPDVISVAFRPRAGIKIPKIYLKQFIFWGILNCHSYILYLVSSAFFPFVVCIYFNEESRTRRKFQQKKKTRI